MTELETRFTELVGVRYPIMQDAMGTYKTVHLAATVSNAGGLGTISIPGTTIPPEEGATKLRAYLDEALDKTSKPLAVNVAVLSNEDRSMAPLSAAYIRAVIDARREGGPKEKQITVLTTSAAFPAELSQEIHDSGLVHMHKVGSARAALRAQEGGADAVIAAGFEMGGHTHNKPVHTFVLGPNVADKVDIPIVLAGGIRDGRGLAAALNLGADAVAMGTRFVASDGNQDWDPQYACRVLDVKEGQDVLFQGVFGPVRGIWTPAVEVLAEKIAAGVPARELNRWKDLAFIRAQELGDFDTGLAPVGQVASGIDDMVAVEELLPRMVDEAISALRRATEICTASASNG